MRRRWRRHRDADWREDLSTAEGALELAAQGVEVQVWPDGWSGWYSVALDEADQ